MKLYNPFRFLSRFEWGLWGISLLTVVISFFVGGGNGWLSLMASVLGVTALIFVAKGDVTGQILTVAFSVLYAVISWKQHYYGEMITYLLMSAPIAFFSVISWLRHPYAKDRSEVRVVHLHLGDVLLSIGLSIGVSVVFYWILAALGNAELTVSTLSVTTSFLAAYLLYRRSPWYALAYAANDVVLIVLWCIASAAELSSLSMVACFVAFLFNDLYAFFNWRRLRRRQNQSEDLN